MLKNRDDEEGAPEWYLEKVAKSKYVEKNKDKIWLEYEEYSNFCSQLMGGCTRSCINQTTTSVITTGESECMNNCYSKGQEVGSLMRLFNADDDIRRYGGFRFEN